MTSETYRYHHRRGPHGEIIGIPIADSIIVTADRKFGRVL